MAIHTSSSQQINVSIPEYLKSGEFKFIRLKPRSKEPCDAWTNKRHQYDADSPAMVKWLESGGNYGVLCVSGDVCILDADNHTRLEQLGCLDEFADTFTVETGSEQGGHYHYYIRVNGYEPKKIPFYDLVDEKEHLGELYPAGSQAYCVGPGSIHPSGNPYRVLNDSPLKEISQESLDIALFSKVHSKRVISRGDEQLQQKIPNQIVKRFKEKSYSRTLSEELGLTMADVGGMPVGDITKRGDEIQGSHPIHGSTTGKNYSVNLSENLWYCYRCNGGGDPITFLAVREGFIRCDDAGNVPIEGDVFNRVKDVLRDMGYGDKIDALDRARVKGVPSARTVTVKEFEEFAPRDQGHVFQPHLSDSHFIEWYADTIGELTDSYRDYQYASALQLLSMMAANACEMRMSHAVIKPNLWFMLLGSSSYAKKTTAIRFARKFATRIIPRNAVADDITPERFAQDVSEIKNRWQFVDEAASVLTAMKTKAYMASFKEMLCKLYDGEPYHQARSKRRGRPRRGETEEENPNDYVVDDCYINIMYATTPDSFAESTVANDLKSGLFYRFCFFYPQYDKELKPSVEETPDQVKALEEIFNYLDRVHAYFTSLPGHTLRMKMDGPASDFLNAWEMERTMMAHKSHNPLERSAYARVQDIVKRLAMVLEIGSRRFYRELQVKDWQMGVGDEWYIPLETIKEACRLVDEYFTPVFRDVMEKTCSSDIKTVQERILRVINDAGGKIEYRRLQQLVRVNKSAEFIDALNMIGAPSPANIDATHEIEVVKLKSEAGAFKKYVVLVGEGGYD